LSAAAGIILKSIVLIPVADPLFRCAALQRPSIYVAFVWNFAIFLFTTPFLVLPKFRGLRIAESAIHRTIDIFGTGCGLVAREPWPLQFTPSVADDPEALKKFALPNIDKGEALRKLRSYWSRLGFWPLGDTGIYAKVVPPPPAPAFGPTLENHIFPSVPAPEGMRLMALVRPWKIRHQACAWPSPLIFQNVIPANISTSAAEPIQVQRRAACCGARRTVRDALLFKECFLLISPS
jgi:hypothetical protein